jgi:hypothetical protein
MFERYTEQARRAIFFARFEASQYGSPVIDLEHLLLGLLREDKLLRSLLPIGAAEAIRRQLEASTLRRDPSTATSVDLPLSNAARRALLLAAEEAERMGDRIIEASYLLLGMFRLETGPAASVLQPYGIDLASYRQAAGSVLLAVQPSPASASQSLAQTIDAIDALVERSGDLQAFSSAGGEQRLKRKPWSRKEALGHLIDWATAHHQWFARALAEPVLAGVAYPNDNWVALERYGDLPWTRIVDLWASLNRLLVHVLRQIPEGKLNLPCRIGIAEPIPLERLVANYLEHLEDVLGQILTRGQAG